MVADPGRCCVGVLLRLGKAAPGSRLPQRDTRRLRAGVQTVGTAGGGRREYYCAADEHLIESAQASFDGFGLGRLRPVLPAVQFGFASAPPTPSAVRVTTLIDLPT
jgi:hypothetical protein